MKKAAKAFAGVASAGILTLLALVVYVQVLLPDSFAIAAGEEFYINEKLTVTSSGAMELTPKIVAGDGSVYNLNIDLLGTRSNRAVQAMGSERKMVIPGGTPFGIKMYTEGILVVGLSDIQMGSVNVNPAKEAGIKVGDVLTHIDAQPLEKNADVATYISQSGGQPVTISLLRGSDEMEILLQPVLSQLDNGYKAGIWVRDSSAGIGTMTYYDPESMAFAGLGHAVCDIDTGEIMPLSSGEIVDVNISGVNAGQSGKPGELKGGFIGEAAMGELFLNTECGVFGMLYDGYIGMDPIPMALKQEVQPGPAIIYSTISGNKPQAFEILIEKVNYSDINPTKNMVIKITDERLLAETGGIVQGMSGSPIVQDGQLVGAVTHVFVNDPTRGYGIFADNMDKQLNIVENMGNVA